VLFGVGCSSAAPQPHTGSQPLPGPGSVSWHPDADARVAPTRLLALACDGGNGLSSEAACGGLRQLTLPSGATRVAAEWLPSRGSVEAFRLPASMGGDLLLLQRQPFQTNLWRASDYTAPAKPVAAVSLDVDQVAIGFDRVYLLDRKANELVALDAETGQRLGRGPLPYSVAPRSLAFLNDRVAAIETEVRGVLFTKDAGKTWTPLQLAVNSPAIERVDEYLAISTPTGVLRLSEDGSLTHQLDETESTARVGALTGQSPAPIADESASAESPSPVVGERGHGALGSFPLRAAVLYGFPDSEGGALVLSGGALSRVRLEDGAILRSRPDLVREPGPCPALKFGDSVAFVCSSYIGSPASAAARTVVYVYEPPFGLRELVSFGGPRAVSGGAGGLVVRGGCASAPTQGALCAVPVHGAPWQYALSSNPSRGGSRAFLAADGKLVVLVPPSREGERARTPLKAEASPPAHVEWARAGKRVATVAVPIPETEAGALLRNGLWLDGWAEDAGTLAGWVAGGESFVGLRISAEGVVSPGIIQKRLSETLFDGPRALVVRQGAVAFESEDYGFSWREVALPNAALDDNASSKFPRGCSRIGCAIGRWMRLGWGGEAAAQLPAVAMPEAPRGKRVRGKRWSFHCHWEKPSKGGAVADKSRRRREGSWTPFYGDAPPRVRTGDVRYEYTAQRGYQAYAWGPTREHWAGQAKWLVRAFDWFTADSPVWSSAATPIPWTDAVTTASRFGVGSAVRWTVDTDPTRHTGLMVLGDYGNEQVFQFSERSRIGELASARGVITHGLRGVVRIGDRWYAGVQQTRGAFLVYELTASDATLIAELPIRGPRGRLTARLVRSVPDDDLGVLVQALGVRSVDSRWAIYPLDRDERSVGEPIALDQKTLGHQPRVCEPDARGWLIATKPPLLPRVEVDDGRVWLNDVFLRGIFNGETFCVDALGAWGRVRRPTVGARSKSAGATRNSRKATLSLVVADRLKETRATLRCSP
jgi:hypothetical protein